MKTLVTILSLATLIVGFSTPNARAETLGEILKAEGLDKMLGTWVDQDTNGEAVRVVYKWKIKNHAIELNVKTQQGATTALIALDPKTQEPIHFGVNYEGTLARGKWSKKDGAAVLDLKRITADGQESEMSVAHIPVDKKSLKITFSIKGSDETMEATLVRPAKKDKAKGKDKKKDGKKKDKGEKESEAAGTESSE